MLVDHPPFTTYFKLWSDIMIVANIFIIYLVYDSEMNDGSPAYYNTYFTALVFVFNTILSLIAIKPIHAMGQPIYNLINTDDL